MDVIQHAFLLELEIHPAVPTAHTKMPPPPGKEKCNTNPSFACLPASQLEPPTGLPERRSNNLILHHATPTAWCYPPASVSIMPGRLGVSPFPRSDFVNHGSSPFPLTHLCKVILPVNPDILQLVEAGKVDGAVLVAVEWHGSVQLHVDSLLL